MQVILQWKSSSFDSIVHIISEYSATLFKPCVECNEIYGYIECYDDILQHEYVIVNCNPSNDKIRYYSMCKNMDIC